MGWFSPRPLTLKVGEPIHQLVARALMHGAIKECEAGFMISGIDYHFVGPHGIEYRGTKMSWGETHFTVAKLCEETLKDFNSRMTATANAMKTTGDSVPMFASLLDKPEHEATDGE